MIFLPLGLQARIKDFPWFSLGILAVTVFFFLMRDKSLSDYTKYRLNLPEMQEAEWRLRLIKAANCGRSSLTHAECLVLNTTIEKDRPQNLIQYSIELQRQTRLQNLNDEAGLRIIKYLREPLAESLRPMQPGYFDAKDKSDALLFERQKKDLILTGANTGPAALLASQFSHDGWMHILGNMLVLLGFVIFVEQYLGPFKTALIYFAGGSVGLLLQLPLIKDAHTPLVGASANVFAIGGAFLILYWRKQSEVLCSFMFVLNKRLHVPVWVYFLAFLSLREITGALNQGTTHVAHLAHLGGLGIGMAITWLLIKDRRLPEQFTFPYEVQEFDKLQSATGHSARLNILLNLLFYNHLNGLALLTLAKNSTSRTTWNNFPEGAQNLIRRSTHDQVNHLIDTGRLSELAEMLHALPPSWPVREMLPELSPFRKIQFEKVIAKDERREIFGVLLQVKGA